MSAADVIAVLETRDGVTIAIRVRPGARRTGAAGVRGAALLVDVAAPPEKGKANDALLKWARRALGPLDERPSIRSGQTSRSKVVLLPVADREAVRQRLRDLLDDG